MKDKSGPFELTVAQKNALFGIYHGDGLKAVREIMEYFCAKSENEFIGEHPTDDKAVLAAHAVMYAQNKYFKDVWAYIDRTISDHLGVKLSPEEMQEQVMASIVSDVPETEH